MGALGKKYLNCYWTYDANIRMECVQGGDLSACKRIFQILNFEEVITFQKHPKLGIHILNAGDDNKSFHIITVIFNQKDRLQVLLYHVYISTLLYTNVSISTSLWGCDSTYHNQKMAYYRK